jgi:hypothetical protein
VYLTVKEKQASNEREGKGKGREKRERGNKTGEKETKQCIRTNENGYLC